MSDPTPSACVAVCPLSDVEPGGIAGADLPDGTRVALYRVDDEVYATDDHCTHGASSLSEEGTLDGYVIECGMHLGSFDVRTGQPVSPPCTKAIRTFPAQVKDGTIWLSIEQPQAQP